MPLKCTRRRRQLASPAPAVRLHKAAHAEVSKHDRHRHSNQQTHMPVAASRGFVQRCPHLPCVHRSKHSKNPKENPGQLQPQCPRQPHERPPHRLAKPPATLLQPSPRLPYLSGSPRGLLYQPTARSSALIRSCRRSRSSRPRSSRPRSSRSRSSRGTCRRTLFRLGLRRRIRRRRRIHR